MTMKVKMAKPKILVIEDNDITRKFVRVTLEGENYEVLEAPNGKTALEIVQINIPNLVLMDLRLPDIDGCEIARTFRSMPELADVPLIAFTGFVPQTEESKVSMAGFTGFIIKPIEPSRLLQLIKEHLTPKILPEYMFNKRLLIVDDDPIQLRLTRTIMGQLGLQVAVACHGAEALEKILQFPPDLVLSDILMPVMDGFKLCMAIKQDSNLKNIPVVLASTHFLEKEDRDFALAAGASGLAVRTPDFKEVIEALVVAFNSANSDQTKIDSTTTVVGYEHRIIRQLERQASMNATLSQQSLLQNIVTNISTLIAKHRKIESNLPSVFAQCLDIGGLSFGAIFLKNTHGILHLRTQVGFTEEARNYLKSISVQLAEWADGNVTISVPSKKVPEAISKNFLEKTNLRGATITSIMAGQDCLGALLLGADSRDIDKRDWVALAQALATQFGQGLSISQAASKLSVTEDRARIFMENANDGIFVTDLQGKLLEVNKKALELYKRPSHEILGHNYTEFVVSNQLKSTAIEYQKATEGATVARNIGLIRPDGSIVEIDFSSSVVQIGGEKLIFSVGHDVTERNKLQRSSIQSEKLATMGTLTAGVAHEINNPLSYVLTNVELLSECMSEITKETLDSKKVWIEKSLKQISEGVNRVKSITTDLKIFSRSRDTEKDAIINLESILESSINMAAHEIKYRAKIVKSFGEIFPVMAHEGRLGQVFLNLLVNAAQAIPEGNANGNEIRVTTQMQLGLVSIDIQDSGSGMSPEIMGRLFTPFFTTKPEGLGTGLGLSICQNIIHGFGGEIKVESVVGQGTTFHILLPPSRVNIDVSKETQSINQRDEVNQRGRILVIDDEPDLAEVYGQVLSKDHEVVVMTSGRKAFELLLKDNNFDAILSDLTMPDMAGMDIYTELSRLKNGAEKRMVFISGGVFTQRAHDFLKNIPNKLIEKPIDTKALRKLGQDLVQKCQVERLKQGA
jgi:PAS domain S-box-containing protein